MIQFYTIRVETHLNGVHTSTVLRYGGTLSAGVLTYVENDGPRLCAIGFDFQKWNIVADFHHEGMQNTIKLLECALMECGESNDCRASN